MKIVAISGSLRKASFNTALLRAASGMLPAADSFELADYSQVPVYNGDLEAESGLPDSVVAFKDQLRGAEAFLMSTPEYNQGVPGGLKNALDWASRGGDSGEIFSGKPIGLMGATPGRLGTLSAQGMWLPTFRGLGLNPFLEKSLMVGGASKLFDEDLKLTDEASQKRLQGFIEAYLAFARKMVG